MKTRDNHLKRDGHPKRVLSLDGGGVRGIFELGVLKILEDELRARSGLPDYRLCEYFDFIGGTSTGSIIASALAMGSDITTIISLYRKMIPEIFRKPERRLRHWLNIRGVTSPLYEAHALSDGLKDFFGNKTLGSSHLRTGLAIHCKRMDTGSPWVLVNNPNWEFYGKEDSDDVWKENRRFWLRDLIQASTAAPHYFKGVQIKLTDGEGDQNEWAHMVDGGVSGNNNPSMEMLLTLRDNAYGFDWPLGHKNLMMLSVGTGYMRLRFEQGEFEDLTYIWQTINSLKSMMHDISLQQLVTMQAVSYCRDRWYINMEKQDQPSAPYLVMDQDRPLLDFQRIDFRLDKPSHNEDGNFVRDLIDGKITKTEMKNLREMACATDRNLDLLYELGLASGRRFITAAYPDPHFNLDQWRVGPGPSEDTRV